MPTDTSPERPPTSTAKSANNTAAPQPNQSADKNAGKKFDAFHPDMPTIPGVGGAAAPPSEIPTDTLSEPSLAGSIPVNTLRIARIGGIIVAIVLVVVGVPWWIKHKFRAPVELSSPAEPGAQPSVPDSPPSSVDAPAQEGPTVAATVEDLSKTWSSKKFTFVRPVTHEIVNALVIRLPGGSLWAFALREPYGDCELQFVTDLGQIQQKYGYRATHPMAVNPCNRTVYDPLKVGPLDNTTWARGEVVQGGGLRPPFSIDIQVRGHSIIADGIE